MPIYKIKSINEIGPIGLFLAAQLSLAVIIILSDKIDRKKKIKILRKKGYSIEEAKKLISGYKSILDKINYIEFDKRLIPLMDKYFTKSYEYIKYSNIISKKILDSYKKELHVDKIKDNINSKIDSLKRKIDYSDIEKEFNKIKDDLHPEKQDISHIKKWISYLEHENFMDWEHISDEIFNAYRDMHMHRNDFDDEEFYAEEVGEMNDDGIYMEYEKEFMKSIETIENLIYNPISMKSIMSSIKLRYKK